MRDIQSRMAENGANIPVFMLDMDWKDELRHSHGVHRLMWERALIALLTIYEIVGHPGGRILVVCDAGRHRSVSFMLLRSSCWRGVQRRKL